MNHYHSVDIPAYLFELHAGQDENSSIFQQQYKITADWDFNCTACCLTYLIQNTGCIKLQGDYNRVIFGQAEKNCWPQCYISPIKENSKHGQYKTKPNPSYGLPVAGSLIKKNSTIRLYSQSYTSEPTVLGTSINVIARVESIAVPNVTQQKLMSMDRVSVTTMLQF